MRTLRPKPQSLRPLSAKHRRWFWILMAVGALIIVTGWLLTIKNLLADVPTIQSSIQAGVSQAAEEIEEADLKPDGLNEVEEALQALQAGYEIEKQRQETSSEQVPIYEQEDSNP